MAKLKVTAPQGGAEAARSLLVTMPVPQAISRTSPEGVQESVARDPLRKRQTRLAQVNRVMDQQSSLRLDAGGLERRLPDPDLLLDVSPERFRRG